VEGDFKLSHAKRLGVKLREGARVREGGRGVLGGEEQKIVEKCRMVPKALFIWYIKRLMEELL
jgi:hypothetical protein